MDTHEHNTVIIERIERCRQAFSAGVTRPAEWRAAQLDALVKMLNEHSARFQAALGEDLGKPGPEAWLTEISYVVSAARHARRQLPRWMRERRVRTPLFAQPGRSWIHPEPLGTVLIISPWNYPLQLCLAPLVSAVAAGNCAVIKPSELAPATSAALAELLPRYLDPEAIAVIEGDADTASALLAQYWDHIVFTGGERVARIVMAAAARHLTPVTLELGGKSPCIVLPDADLEVAARRIAWGRFTNAGQTCIAPDHVLTDAPTRERLLPLLDREITMMFGSDPRQSPDYGRIVNAQHHDRLMGLVRADEVTTGGQGDRAERYIAPTVLGRATADSPSMQEEIFGPLLPVLEIAGLDAALDFVTRGPKPLAAYLFTNDAEAQRKTVERLSAGSVCINDVMLFMAVDGLPFGGVGASGFGSYKGEDGFLRLSHSKAVLRRTARPDWRIRYAPLTKGKMKWLRRLR
ncbi:MAG: aldehyde dehydrogenase family protein [Xanthomonadales bacterium]|nr:aldehyde dehydrogenase family protein [Xanthomonadales bacterium]